MVWGVGGRGGGRGGEGGRRNMESEEEEPKGGGPGPPEAPREGEPPPLPAHFDSLSLGSLAGYRFAHLYSLLLNEMRGSMTAYSRSTSTFTSTTVRVITSTVPCTVV